MCARKHTVTYFSGWMIDGWVDGWMPSVLHVLSNNGTIFSLC